METVYRSVGNGAPKGVNTPILFLTAMGEEFDVVRALDAGGNDYVTKPFKMQELLSRMRVLTRSAVNTVPAAGGLEWDTERMQVRRAGEVLPLKLTEYKVLTLLAQSKGIVPRTRLLEILWDKRQRTEIMPRLWS